MLRLIRSIALYFVYFLTISFELIRFTLQKAIGFTAHPITADLSPKIALQLLGVHSHESNKTQPLVSFFLSLIPVGVEDDEVELKSKTSYTDKGISSEFRLLYDGPKFTLITIEDGLDADEDGNGFDLTDLTTNYEKLEFSESNPYSIYALNAPLFMFTALSGHSPQGLLEFYIHKENKNKGIILDTVCGYSEGFMSALLIDATETVGLTQQDNQDNLLAPPWYAFFTDKSDLFEAISETGCSGYLNVNGLIVPLSQP